MAERLGPSLAQIQSLEKRESQLRNRLSRVEGMYEKVKRPEIPREKWTPAEHLMAAKTNQLTNVHQRVGTNLFTASSNLEQALLDYHQNYQEPQEVGEERRRLIVLRRMAQRGLTEDLSVGAVDQQIQDFDRSHQPLTDSLQQRLNGLLVGQPQPEKISEEEAQRRQALQDAISSFKDLTILQRKSLAVGVIYSPASPGSNRDWAKLMNYGKNVPEDEAVNRLLISRRKALEKTKGRIEMGNERQGRAMPHYLILKEAVAQPARPRNKEEMRRRKIAGLRMLTNIAEELIDQTLINEVAKNLEMPKNRALFALKAQVGEVYVKVVKIGNRARVGKRATWEEQQLWNKIKSISQAADDKEAVGAFAQWLNSKFYPAPVVELPTGPSRSGAREKQTVNMPDGTILEAAGKRGKSIQYLVDLAGNSQTFSVREFARFLYNSDNKTSIQAAKAALRNTRDFLTEQGWKFDLPQSIKDIDAPIAVNLTKAQLGTQTEIAQLEENIRSLEGSREAILEATQFNLPGAQENLASLDQTLAEKRETLKGLQG